MDSCCARGYWPFRIDNFEKNVEAKKSPPFSPVNYTSEKSSQPGHSPSISWSNKKNFRPYQGSNNCQQSSILVTEVNAAIMKKNRKSEKNISLVECFCYQKTSYYVNKCPNM